MSEWQKILKDDAVATLDKLAEKFGHDVIASRLDRLMKCGSGRMSTEIAG